MNASHPHELVARLRAVTADLAMLMPELVALARHLESAAVRGETAATVTLGQAVEAVMKKLGH